MSVSLALPVFPECLAVSEKSYALYLKSCENVVSTYCSAFAPSSARFDGFSSVFLGDSGRKQLASGLRFESGAADGVAACDGGSSSVFGGLSDRAGNGGSEFERSGGVGDGLACGGRGLSGSGTGASGESGEPCGDVRGVAGVGGIGGSVEALVSDSLGEKCVLTKKQKKQQLKYAAQKRKKAEKSGACDAEVESLSEVGEVEVEVVSSAGEAVPRVLPSVEEVVPEWRKAAGPVGRRGVGVKSSLQSSLEAKWAAQNAVAELKAKQELELLQKRDLQKEAKMRDRKVQKVIDRTMVQIEKDHAFLASTGNVPELPGGGFCKTVVDGEGSSVPGLSGGTISPNSSISEKEVRELLKENVDMKAKLAVYERRDVMDGRFLRMVEGSVDFTVGSDGEVPEEIMKEAAERFEGPEFLKVGPVVEGKRSLAFDRMEFSYSGNYSQHY